MEKQSDVSKQMIEAALQYLELGYRPIPIVAGKKTAAIKWKKYQTVVPSASDMERWFSAGTVDIALVTGNGVVVVDVDDPELVARVIEHCGETPMRCRTPKGGQHLYYKMRPGVRYRNAVRVKSKAIDLRSNGAYAVCPWSRSDRGVSYEWLEGPVPAAELPSLRMSWLRERRPRRVVPLPHSAGSNGVSVRRAHGYLAHIEGAISGQRGHDRTFRVACVLVIKFGLSFEQAWPLFREWNEQCEPRWSEKELRHKLEDALKKRRSGIYNTSPFTK